MSNIENKYITNADYIKLSKGIIDNSIKTKNLVTKTDFDTKLQDISKRIISDKTKHLHVENELKKKQKPLTQVFLVVRATLSMMRHSFFNISTYSQNYYNIFWSSRNNLIMGI